MKWKILGKIKEGDIVSVLLKNRGIKKNDQKDFFDPPSPLGISLASFGVKKNEMARAVKRIKEAITQKEKIIVYGDYDTDGVCATAILWEALYSLGADTLPFIPDRFKEGYGMSETVIALLKKKFPNLRLIITVDNGINAFESVKKVKKLGIDVIITDHHEVSSSLPKAFSIIHTLKVCGSGISWILARELGVLGGLDLAAIGTIADMMPVLGVNRSFVKHGLSKLRKTKRKGVISILKAAGLRPMDINTYHVGFVIGPRINAMGRISSAMDSLRMLCTTSTKKANLLGGKIENTNKKRQETTEEVIAHAQQSARKMEKQKIIIVSHESYHEGVIGLAAAKLVEQYYRPAVVFSKGKEFSKASARSVSGFSIVKAIRRVEHLLVAGGGHDMAAGFTIRTEDFDRFVKEMRELSEHLLTDEVLTRSLRIDAEVDFESLSFDLLASLKKFEPSGIGNPSGVFATRKVVATGVRKVGREGDHLKLTVIGLSGKKMDAIGFGFGDRKIESGQRIDIAYTIEENLWNGKRELQLKLKDIRTKKN